METIIARCPGCQKLYGVDPKDIKDQQPEFLCRKCGQKFWFEYPPVEMGEEVQTFLKNDSSASPPKPDTNTKQCPKCKAENPKSNTSCMYCGIIFDKFGKKREPEKPAATVGTAVLTAQWDNLLASYEKAELHEKFISDCLGAKQLTFASAQYRKMLEANPNDTIALKMRDKIIGLATMTFIPPRRPEVAASKSPNFSIFFAIIALLGGVLGTLVPSLKWLQPIGFSLFLILAGVIGYKFYKSKNEA